jgi:hypothetical protein
MPSWTVGHSDAIHLSGKRNLAACRTKDMTQALERGGTMSDDRSGEHRGAEWYEIRFRGHLEPRWAAWFDGMRLTQEDDGTTRINGPVLDQAALYGLLQRARDVGLPLVSVTQVAAPPVDR